MEGNFDIESIEVEGNLDIESIENEGNLDIGLYKWKKILT